MIKYPEGEEIIPSNLKNTFLSILSNHSIYIGDAARNHLLRSFHFKNIHLTYNDFSSKYPRRRYYKLLEDITTMFTNKIVRSCEDNNRNEVCEDDIDFAVLFIRGRCGIFPCSPDSPDFEG